MKILQLVTKRQYRGAEVFAANLSEELSKFGHEVIFCGLYGNKSELLVVENCLNLDLVESKSNGFNLQIVKRLVKLIKKHQPDIIQCNGSDTLKYMVAATFFIPKIPVVYRNISVISEWMEGDFKLNLYKYLFKRIGHVTSVGSESIQDLIKTLDYPKDQTSVIRRGIPLKKVDRSLSYLRKGLNLQPSDKIVMHIGNFSPEKNHEFLLDIFTNIKKSHPEIKLVLVGTGVTYDTIINLIEELNLNNTVFPLGFRRDIPELLSQADCFALCSKVEGVPGVILEAASQKIPSISTNVGGVNEVLLNNKTGYIIDNFDKENYYKKLLQLVGDNDLRLEMGKKAYERVAEDFNPEKNVKKFISLYQALINNLNNPFAETSSHLRILQIIQRKQFRGAEVFASQISQKLVDEGHNVKMISIYEGSASLPFSQEIISLNRPVKKRGFDFAGWRKLNTLITEFKPDIVQANASDTLKYTVLSKVFFRWSGQIVYRNASISSYYIKNKVGKVFNSFLLRYVDLIISVSKSSLVDLNKFYPVTVGKTILIPVGIEPKSEFPKKTFQDKMLLHIGSFTPEKNHIELLQIFDSVSASETELKLYLIGSGPGEKEIRDEITRLGLEKKVVLLGEFSNPAPYIEAADILVLTSRVEGLPAVILESMFYETPVIAYDVGGISEVLNSNTGNLIPYGNREMFVNAIINIINNKNALKIQNAKKLVGEQFNNEKIALQFSAAYKNLI